VLRGYKERGYQRVAAEQCEGSVPVFDALTHLLRRKLPRRGV